MDLNHSAVLIIRKLLIPYIATMARNATLAVWQDTDRTRSFMLSALLSGHEAESSVALKKSLVR